MQEVTASIGYSGMNTSDFLARFGPIFRSLLFLALPPLSLGELLFILSEEFGVANGLASGEDHKVFQSQISANCLLSGIKVGDIILYQNAHKIAISGVFGDGHSARFA